jgi:hypothetical protein
MFDSDEHSIPAFPSAVEVMMFVPDTMIVAALAEMMTDAVVLTLMSSKTIMTSLLLISTLFVIDVPVTTIASTGLCVSASHVTCPAMTVTDSTVILQVNMKMK